MGAIIVRGRLDEHEKFVSIIKEVDVVISALAYPQVVDQIKILEGIKIAGNIKRFVQSDFGFGVDRVISVLPPLETYLEKKRRIRGATEDANIPYTCISSNCCVVLNYEEDIGTYTIKVTTDPRTRNRVVIFRPPTNIISQLDLISLWENKIGRSFNKIHVSDKELVALSQTLQDPHNIPISILHSVLIRGNFDIAENDIEASALFPELKFATVDQLLHVFLNNPPKPTLATFG